MDGNCRVDNDSQIIKFSVSKESITPDWPVNMGGYSARVEKSVGMHEQFYSKCLILDDGRTRFLLINLDLVGLDKHFIDEIKRKIEVLYGIAGKDILVSSIHTHAGPSTYPFPSFPSTPEDNYMEFLLGKIMDGVKNSMAEVQEGTVEVGTGVTYIGMNRRNYKGGVDRKLNVITIKDNKGSVRVVLFNNGCHAVVMDAENLLLSADFPGAACKYIEEIYPKSTAIFLQGAAGDINPAIRACDGKKRKCGFSDVDFTGRILANDVRNVIINGMKQVNISINCSIDEIKLPLTKPDVNIFKNLYEISNGMRRDYAERMLALLASGADLSNEVVFRAALISLACDLRIVALEGEICHEVGMALSNLFDTGCTLIVGYSNGVLSYIPTANILKEGGYEANANCISYGIHSCFASNVVEVLIDWLSKKIIP